MSLLRPRVCDDRGRPTLRGVPIDVDPIATALALIGATAVLAAVLSGSFEFSVILLPAILLPPSLFYLVVAVWEGAGGRGGIRKAKARGRCASCRYELEMCRVDHDGCTVCPECGAAWRLHER